MRLQPIEDIPRTAEKVLIILQKLKIQYGKIPNQWYWKKFWPQEFNQADRE